MMGNVSAIRDEQFFGGFDGGTGAIARDAARAEARRNKLLGLWAAKKLGKTDAEAQAYADELVADIDLGGVGLTLQIISDRNSLQPERCSTLGR